MQISSDTDTGTKISPIPSLCANLCDNHGEVFVLWLVYVYANNVKLMYYKEYCFNTVEKK